MDDVCQTKVIPSEFFRGEVFKATWITDSIKAGQLLDKDDYHYKTMSPEEFKTLKKFELGGNWPYTLTEAFKINEIYKKNESRAKGATFWREIEFKGLIPHRTGDSMRNFLKVQLKFGLMHYYREHVSTQKYSHAFKHILQVKREAHAPLNKDEKQYLRTAIWSEYQMENNAYNKQATNKLMTSLQAAAQPKTNTVDHLISNRPGLTRGAKSSVVTYDLKDIS